MKLAIIIKKWDIALDLDVFGHRLEHANFITEQSEATTSQLNEVNEMSEDKCKAREYCHNNGTDICNGCPGAPEGIDVYHKFNEAFVDNLVAEAIECAKEGLPSNPSWGSSLAYKKSLE